MESTRYGNITEKRKSRKRKRRSFLHLSVLGKVKAILSSSPEKLPGADTLWIRWQRGYLHPQPWAIKIIEDMGTLGKAVAKEYY